MIGFQSRFMLPPLWGTKRHKQILLGLCRCEVRDRHPSTIDVDGGLAAIRAAEREEAEKIWTQRNGKWRITAKHTRRR